MRFFILRQLPNIGGSAREAGTNLLEHPNIVMQTSGWSVRVTVQ